MTMRASRRMWMALLLAAVLAAGLLALATSASEPADAAQFKTVTKTFNKNGLIKIPDDPGSVLGPASPYPSEEFVSVSSFPKGATLVDVNLTLRDFTHGSPNDVDMMLVHRGVNRTVFSDTGSFFDVDNLTITLDDQAPAPPPSNNPLTSGKFKPFNAAPLDDNFEAPAPAQSASAKLKGFKGLNPQGSWKLFIQDDTNFGSGALVEGWSLKIKAKVPKN